MFFLRSPTRGEAGHLCQVLKFWNQMSLPHKAVGLGGSWKRERPICLWARAPQVTTGFFFLYKKDPEGLGRWVG